MARSSTHEQGKKSSSGATREKHHDLSEKSGRNSIPQAGRYLLRSQYNEKTGGGNLG
jgi:hypothetical protein